MRYETYEEEIRDLGYLESGQAIRVEDLRNNAREMCLIYLLGRRQAEQTMEETGGSRHTGLGSPRVRKGHPKASREKT